MCNSHLGDAGKAQAFWTYGKATCCYTWKKNEKPTGEDFATARGEQILCEPIAHFHLHPWKRGQGRLTKRNVGQRRKGGITCRQGELFLMGMG